MKIIFHGLVIVLWPTFIFSQVFSEDSLLTFYGAEVVISVDKDSSEKNRIANEVFVIQQKEIERIQASNTADILSAMGIPVQKSQMGGGSPILRGFEASRIVLAIDGVRLNNIIYRTGHLQDIVKTDPLSMERIEILYGPSSLRYGSDALGGVIHMYTKSPILASDSHRVFKLSALARYSSAMNGIGGHVDFHLGSQKWATFSSFTYQHLGDLMMGKNQNPFYAVPFGERDFYAQSMGDGKDSLVMNSNRFLQRGTGYDQYDLVQKIIFQPNTNQKHLLNIQLSNSTQVPRYDRLTDPSSSTGLKFAEWYYGPQTRGLAAYDVEFKHLNTFFNSLVLGVNYQYIDESRHTRNFNNPFLNSRFEKVHVLGAHMNVKNQVKQHEFRWGLDFQMNFLQSTAEKRNIEVDTLGQLSTRYPDGINQMYHLAAYFSHQWKISDQLILTEGFRVGFANLYANFKDRAQMFRLPYSELEQKTPVYSGSIGLIHNWNKLLKLTAMLSTGFRVPNADDLTKIFDSKPGLVIVPNINLKPEKTITYEIGITLSLSEKCKIEQSLYYTDFIDIAIVDKFSFNGQDSIDYDGTLSAVYANQNKKSAYIFGSNTTISGILFRKFQYQFQAMYTFGRIKSEFGDQPLDHIAPFMCRAALSYQMKKMNFNLSTIYNSWKKLSDYYLNGEDNEQYASPEGMPAWMVLNLNISYQIHKHVVLQFGIDNILDTQYRVFASGMNAPGRNFIISIKGQI